jgi:hypothetical protein
MRAQGMTYRVGSRYYIQQPLHLEGLEFCLQYGNRAVGFLQLVAGFHSVHVILPCWKLVGSLS